MTKISNQYSLTNVLFADTTNGRVGVNNTSPTVALDVTGAGKFTNSGASDGLLSINSTFADGYRAILRLSNTHTGGKNWDLYSTNSGDGVYGAGKFVIRNNTDSVNALTITSVGNVGIGTTSPASKLDIQETATNTYGTLSIRGNNRGAEIGFFQNSTISASIYSDGTANNLVFTTGGYTERMRITSGGNVQIKNSTADTAIEIFYNGTTSTGAMLGDANNFIIGGQTGKGMTFCTNNLGQEKMRITVGGNVLIGTTTDNGYKLNVSGSIYSSGSIVSNGSMYAVGGIGSQGNVVTDYGYGFGLNSNTQNSANAWNFYVSSSFSNYFRFFYGGTGVGSGSAKFQIDTGGGYTGLSDGNKKKDITLSTLGLAEVMQLKPSTFKFKDDENQEEQIGFIAQEVKDIIPQAYYEDKEGNDKFIGLKQTAFIPVLVKAIQEQQTQINELKALINA